MTEQGFKFRLDWPERPDELPVGSIHSSHAHLFILVNEPDWAVVNHGPAIELFDLGRGPISPWPNSIDCSFPKKKKECFMKAVGCRNYHHYFLLVVVQSILLSNINYIWKPFVAITKVIYEPYLCIHY
jgi:hypothetical protein